MMETFTATINIAFRANGRAQAKIFAEAIAEAIRRALITPEQAAGFGLPFEVPLLLEVEADDIEGEND